MSLLGLGAKALYQTGRRGVGLAKFATGGALNRALIGGAAGAIYNALTSDYDNPNMTLGSIARGAILGATLGASTRFVTPALKGGRYRPSYLGSMAKAYGYKNTARTAWSGAKYAYSGGRKVASAAFSAVKTMAKYPRTTAVLVGTGLAGYSLYQKQFSSPSLEGAGTNLNYREDEEYSRLSTGIAPMSSGTTGRQIRHRQLMQSTQGLGFGLHNNRH